MKKVFGILALIGMTACTKNVATIDRLTSESMDQANNDKYLAFPQRGAADLNNGSNFNFLAVHDVLTGEKNFKKNSFYSFSFVGTEGVSVPVGATVSIYDQNGALIESGTLDATGTYTFSFTFDLNKNESASYDLYLSDVEVTNPGVLVCSTTQPLDPNAPAELGYPVGGK